MKNVKTLHILANHADNILKNKNNITNYALHKP